MTGHNSVGVPQKVPFVVPKKTPDGKALSLMAHEVISPGPVRMASSGMLLWTVLLRNSMVFGE